MPPLSLHRNPAAAAATRVAAPAVPAASEQRQYKILQSSRAPAQLTLALRRGS